MTTSAAPRRVIDISTPLDDSTPCYPGDSRFERTIVHDMRNGDGYNLSSLTMSAHSGTHLDAPRHFLPDGATIDMLDPSRFVSDALVADFSGLSGIGVAELAGLPLRNGCSLLIRANAHMREGDADARPATLTEDGARLLCRLGVNIVGIDWLSIEADADPAYPVHHILLSNGVLICEGLRLEAVPPGWYTLLLSPLAVTGGDGAPARALLLA